MEQYLQARGTPTAQLILEGWVDQQVSDLSADVALDAAKWGIPTWGSSYTFVGAIVQLKNYYFTPRRTHFYITHNTSNGGIIPDSAVPARVRIRHIEGSPASGDQDEEFIVLNNPGAFAVDLSGWALGGGSDRRFDPGTVIVSGGVI